MRFAPAVVDRSPPRPLRGDPCEAAGDLSRDMERLERLRETVDVEADRIDYAEGERKIVASGAVRIVLGTRTAVCRRGLGGSRRSGR